jgi:hypothetical protein
MSKTRGTECSGKKKKKDNEVSLEDAKLRHAQRREELNARKKKAKKKGKDNSRESFATKLKKKNNKSMHHTSGTNHDIYIATFLH